MLAYRPRAFIATLVAVVVALIVLPGSASAVEGDFFVKECHSNTGSGGACYDDNLALGNTYQTAVSPDGRHAYVSSWGVPANGGSISIYDRNPVTGQLLQRTGAENCYRDAPAGGDCTDVEQMARPLGVLVSPDGDHVFVAAYGSNGITVFDRNSDTGRLTQKPAPNGCLRVGGDGTTCKAGRALASSSGSSRARTGTTSTPRRRPAAARSRS